MGLIYLRNSHKWPILQLFVSPFAWNSKAVSSTRHFDFAEVHSFRLLKEERPKLQFFFTFPSKPITDTMAHLARIANMNCSRSIISQWSKSPLLAQQVCNLTFYRKKFWELHLNSMSSKTVFLWYLSICIKAHFNWTTYILCLTSYLLRIEIYLMGPRWCGS